MHKANITHLLNKFVDIFLHDTNFSRTIGAAATAYGRFTEMPTHVCLYRIRAQILPRPSIISSFMKGEE